jgi:hypothetical protein
MDINESGGDHAPAGINFRDPAAADFPEFDDPAVPNGEIRRETCGSRAVDYLAAADNEIVRARS